METTIVSLGLYRDNGKEDGHYHSIVGCNGKEKGNYHSII